MTLDTLDISLPASPLSRLTERLRRFLCALVAPQAESRKKEERFAEILRLHGSIISGICLAYASDKEDLADLRQDILLNVWKGLERFRGEAALSTWLYRVALNTCVSTVRKRAGRIDLVAFDSIPDMEEETDDSRERLKTLYSLIAGLSPVDKGIITMWLDERSYEEIAEVTGVSRNNVAVRINRIKKRLADKAAKAL